MKSPYDDTNPHFTADLKLSDCCTVAVRHTRATELNAAGER